METVIDTLGTETTICNPTDTATRQPDPSRLLLVAMIVMALAVCLRAGELLATILSVTSLYARH